MVSFIAVFMGFFLRLRRLLFFFNDTATTEIYTLSLHDALPISDAQAVPDPVRLEIFNNLFRSVAEEMGITLQKTKIGRAHV